MSSIHVSPAPSLLGAPIDRRQLTAKYMYENCPENIVVNAEVRENLETEHPTRHSNPVIHKSSLNPSAAPFLTSNSRNDNVVGDLTKFLLKKTFCCRDFINSLIDRKFLQPGRQVFKVLLGN